MSQEAGLKEKKNMTKDSICSMYNYEGIYVSYLSTSPSLLAPGPFFMYQILNLQNKKG